MQLIASLLSQAAIIHYYLHMLYHLKSGGVPMKTQELALVCRYSEEGHDIAQIIQASFDIFLRKELQNVEKHLPFIV